MGGGEGEQVALQAESGLKEGFDWIVERLVEYGFSPNEARIYAYLVGAGPCSANDVAGSLGIYRPYVYRLLSSLQGRGIVLSTLDRPARFSAVPLEKALEMFIDEQKRRVALMESRRGDILAAWQPSTPVGVGHGTWRVQALKGLETISIIVNQMIEDAKSAVGLIVCDPGFLRAGWGRSLQEAGRRAAARGVTMRLLVGDKVRAATLAEPFGDAEVRELGAWQEVPFLIVGDGREVIVSGRAVRGVSALWTDGEVIVSAVSRLYEFLWEASKPVEGSPHSSGRGGIVIRGNCESPLIRGGSGPGPPGARGGRAPRPVGTPLSA